jgi:hypothetical protein
MYSALVIITLSIFIGILTYLWLVGRDLRHQESTEAEMDAPTSRVRIYWDLSTIQIALIVCGCSMAIMCLLFSG